ncbi:DUF1382 family protein [Escherichia coli]
MHKASPVELRTSIEMAHSLAQIGVRFVPIPVAEEIETAEHIKKLRDMRSKSRGNHGIIQPHTR